MAHGETYEEFIEKFKPKKKTTDDCYTPQGIYIIVKDWAVEEYNLQGREIVRPFYPGGDYENFDYPSNCVVIDNPPFSILAKIKQFYADKNIDYFLFAPHLVMFGNNKNSSFVVTSNSITYENGANVNTSFVTNMDDSFIRTAPALAKRIDAEGKKTRNTIIKSKQIYPDELITAASLKKICKHMDLRLNKEQTYYVRRLDAQKEHKKRIFGDGFLISKDKAQEIKAQEMQRKDLVYNWELSDREIKIVDGLK